MMLPEFNGFAIPAVDLECDQLAELEVLDPEAGDPAEWPAWTDAERWEPTPDPRDVEDAYRQCQYQDWLEQEHRFTDRDLMAAGLIPG